MPKSNSLSGVETYIDVGLQYAKLVESWNEPAAGERRAARDQHRAALFKRADHIDRLGHAIEAGGQARQKHATQLGQLDRTVASLEQVAFEVGFECLDLMPNCGGSYVQLRSGIGQALQPTRGLERAQCVERW